jgi:hypothetical protein
MGMIWASGKACRRRADCGKSVWVVMDMDVSLRDWVEISKRGGGAEMAGGQAMGVGRAGLAGSEGG